MAEVDGVTLMMAIQAVDEVIGRLTEATAGQWLLARQWLENWPT